MSRAVARVAAESFYLTPTALTRGAPKIAK